MLSHDDPHHLDFVTLSGHKLYAPYGTGALVGRREIFEQGEPDYRGGGQVEIVTHDSVAWSAAPERDEAGSPNTVGAVALSAAVRQLQMVGMEHVAGHEAELTSYALSALKKIPCVRLFGDIDPARSAERLGVISLLMDGVPHFLLSAILSYEFGIGVRNGCFCAHPYLLHLLRVGEEQAAIVRQNILIGDRRNVPGLVRVSFGLYNSTGDVDVLVDALRRISRGEYSGEYVQDISSGEFAPRGWQADYDQYFSVDKFVRTSPSVEREQ
jgi:selenocysteine lyase/cysteine desulfurase